MTSDTDLDLDLDRRIQEYLQAGPAELSDRVLWAARAQIHTTRRRGRFDRLAPWRDFHMTQTTRLLLAGGGALALVVAIAAGVFSPLLGQKTPGPGASQVVVPSVSPSSGSSLAPSATPSAAAAAPSEPTASAFAAPIVPRMEPTDVKATWTADAASLWTPYLGPDGKIWIPSNIDDQIRIYDQAGKLVETWGSTGSRDGQFFFGAPGAHKDGAGVVFAPDGTFYVLDSGNFRVQHFDAGRRFLGKFGTYGSEAGQFVSPIAIALDDGGNLYVSDGGRHDVQVFTTGGTYVRTVAAGAAGDAVWGSGPGWFGSTRAANGEAGVTEWHADGRIQGGWDFQLWNCEPSGLARDQAPRNIYITCPSPDGVTNYLFRLDEGGTLLHAWRLQGGGIAVNPEGTAAFVVSTDGTTLSRYDLEPPEIH